MSLFKKWRPTGMERYYGIGRTPEWRLVELQWEWVCFETGETKWKRAPSPYAQEKIERVK